MATYQLSTRCDGIELSAPENSSLTPELQKQERTDANRLNLQNPIIVFLVAHMSNHIIINIARLQITMNNWYGPVMMKILHGRCYVDSYVKPLHEAQLPRIVVLFVYFWMQPKFPLELVRLENQCF